MLKSSKTIFPQNDNDELIVNAKVGRVEGVGIINSKISVRTIFHEQTILKTFTAIV